jgi:hypothetical protein
MILPITVEVNEMKKLAVLSLLAVLWLAAGCAEDEEVGEEIGESIEQTTEETGEAIEDAGEELTE